MSEVYYQTIAELAPRIAHKEISPVDITKTVVDRIERLNPTLQAYITITREQVLKAAKQAETEITAGQYRGPLHGIPIGLKDLFATNGVRTTAGSTILRDAVPDYNATVVTKLTEAGALITGKLNMHEFAFGATNENVHYGHARNPWNTEHMTGGSSGGSGAAVAAGLCTAALGTDTGGSIRTPSAFCGIVGIKPTYGLVSKHGVTPLSWSLDHVGPMARCVEDLAIMLEAIVGVDINDPATVDRQAESYREALSRGVKGLRVGVPANYYFDRIDNEVERAVKAAIQTLSAEGADVVDVTIPELATSMYAELVTMTAEASAYHHDTLMTRGREYGDDVRVLLEGGELITAVQYLKAQQVRRLLQEAFAKVFQTVDVLIAPTLPMSAPRIGETRYSINGVPSSEEIAISCVRFAAPCNLTGLPSLSIPVGVAGSAALPVAMQIIGKPFAESTVFQVAAAYERTIERPFRAPLD